MSLRLLLFAVVGRAPSPAIVTRCAAEGGRATGRP